MSGSSTQPTTSTASAWISTAWPLPCDATSVPVGRDRAAGGQLQDLVLVVGQRGRGHDLERVEARAVVDVEEGEAGLRVAAGADPALDRDAAAMGGLAREHVGDARRTRTDSPADEAAHEEEGEADDDDRGEPR